MLAFGVAFLLAGFLFYGKLIELIFGADDKIATPAVAVNDGVDCVPLPLWKTYLIQLLNIAGPGPIFGAIMGACFGPVVMLWVLLGCVFVGSVHDYVSGMISLRHNGASLGELTEIYLGKGPAFFLRIYMIFFLIMVGAVLLTTPAMLLASLTKNFGWANKTFWYGVILVYYLVATIAPVDKIIAKIYPIFGAVLLVMAGGVMGGLLLGDYSMPTFTLADLHPSGLPAWPFLCITVACGAVSGFHATQSPLMAKCITKESQGRIVFYGAMITEGFIALIWAMAGLSFYHGMDGLYAALQHAGQSGVVYEICQTLMGPVGAIIAILGVVVCPISSGDTAFRVSRIMAAEWLKVPQTGMRNRLLIALPILTCGVVISLLEFSVLWRYFSWSNQILAVLAFAIATNYFLRKKQKIASLLTALPGGFMVGVTSTYILCAKEGFHLPYPVSYKIGLAVTGAVFVLYLWKLFRK